MRRFFVSGRMNLMATLELHACFGLELLGMCKYDPQAPSPSYFTIGDAVAALAFTLAVQQFLKPIYQFRLSAMGVRFSYVVFAAFIGAFLTVIAAIVPNVVFLRGTMLGHPVNWEIAGGLIIGTAYAIVATISLRSASVNNRNVDDFTWAGAELLSEATDEDRLSFAKDVLNSRNIQKLVEIAAEFQRAEGHAIAIEFEKLREQGREKEGVLGQPPITAFYAFARRRELELASHAWHFLQLLSDRDFCRVVITRHSWGFLRAIIPLTETNSYTEAAKTFVQAVAWQTLVQNDGMLAREDSYEGFGWTRTFAKEFFGNHKMGAFEPLNGITSIGIGAPSEGFVSRLNIAAELMVSAEIKHRGFWDDRSTSSVVRIYESISHSVLFERSENKHPAYLFELEQGITELSKVMTASLEECDHRDYNILFAEDLEKHRHDSVDEIAKLVCEGLICISNRFQGVEDPAWSFASEILGEIFERYGDVPVGLSPLQQAVAIRLVNKLKNNMDGYYPTLSRVLLAVIGPYKTKAPEKPGSAAAILKDAVYFELKRLPDLYKKDSKKVAERLPPNVTYNHRTRSLTHTYRGGEQVKTPLDNLRIRPVDLLAANILRRRS
jgi:hypothetical protein